jgi:hypothetical protein
MFSTPKYLLQGSGRTGGKLQMNRLGLRNYRLKSKDFRKITDRFRGIFKGIYLGSIKHKPEGVNM